MKKEKMKKERKKKLDILMGKSIDENEEMEL